MKLLGDGPKGEPERKPERCDRCAWLPWEKDVWTFTGLIAYLLVLLILLGLCR